MTARAGKANIKIIMVSGRLNRFNQRVGSLWKNDLGINSAVTMTIMVVKIVWTERAKIGEDADSQSFVLNKSLLMKAPDSMPHTTRAMLLPTNITEINS